MADDGFMPDGFEPDEAPTPIEAPPPGQAEALVRGALQGASFGWSDEAAAAIEAAFPEQSRSFNPDVLAAAPKDADYSMRYAAAREYFRRRNREAGEENPATYIAGTLAGGILTAGGAAKGAAQGGALLSRVARSGAVGAGTGGVAGAGASEADTAAGVARDAAGGVMLGGGVGGMLPLAGAAFSRSADYLGRKAVESGRKALTGIGTPLSARKPVSEEAVRQAIDSGAIRPFGTVTGAAERLGAQAETLGDEYGAILRELEAAGVTGPNAVQLAQKLSLAAQESRRNLALGAARTQEATAQALRESVDPRPFAPKRLPLSQAENIKRNLQREANWERLTDTASSEAKKDVASMVRQAIEDEIEAQAGKAPEQAAKFLPVKQTLARTLEARKAAEEGAARAARRKPISLTDTIVAAGAGSAAGSPVVGLASGVAHGIADRRLASTASVLLRALEKAARKNPSGARAGATAAEEAALLDMLGLRAAGAVAEEDDTP